MTKKMLAQVIDEVDNPDKKLECLGCGEIFNPPPAWKFQTPKCPKCSSEEYVNLNSDFCIPGIESYA